MTSLHPRGRTEALALSTTREGAVRFAVHAKPRARANRVKGARQGALVVEVAAPPVEGMANAAIVETIAGALGLPRRSVVIARGESARTKLVEVTGLAEADVRARLGHAIT